VIPVAFDYVRPSTVDDAIAALADAGDEAKVIAGGQSLLPVLRLRLAAPTLLVDLGGMPQLRGVRDDGDAIVIGAMTTHSEVASDPLVARFAPLLGQTAESVGDRQIRHRGTLGGSLVHADPAADLPSAAVAHGAEYVLCGPSGRRTVSATEFSVDFFTTSMQADEVLLEVRVPKLEGWGVRYQKFHRVVQAWAIVGVAAAVRRENGSIAEARVVLTNMGPIPVRASTVEAALAGCAADGQAIASACAEAAAEASPADDLSASAEYRRHLARVLTTRAVKSAAGV
jgi:aerobic carbon-monoxide dehydrogenase medium subunit